MSTPLSINGILTSQFEIPPQYYEHQQSHPLIQAIVNDNLEGAKKNLDGPLETTKINAIQLCKTRNTPACREIHILLTGHQLLKPKTGLSFVKELDSKFSVASIEDDITSHPAACSEIESYKSKKQATKASRYDESPKKQERSTFHDEASYYSYLDIQAMNGNWNIIKRFLKESEESKCLNFITEKLNDWYLCHK